jgi:hypothetical protein
LYEESIHIMQLLQENLTDWNASMEVCMPFACSGLPNGTLLCLCCTSIIQHEAYCNITGSATYCQTMTCYVTAAALSQAQLPRLLTSLMFEHDAWLSGV